jgi:hypothetical protein
VVDREVGNWGGCPGHQGREGTKEGRAKITRICITKNMRLIVNIQIFRLGDDGPSLRENLAEGTRNHSSFQEIWGITPGKNLKSDEMVEN